MHAAAEIPFRMKTDLSLELQKKYFGLTDPLVEIRLRSGRKLRCTITGYSYADADAETPVIHKWHVVGEGEGSEPGYGELEFARGEMIRHRDIASVFFRDDNSTMTF